MNEKGPILVILAAGMGSRYGGLKQMDKLGENGETLLDYSVFDALRGGFKKIIFIIRRDIENDFNNLVLTRISKNAHCEISFQEIDTFIPPDIAENAKKINRTKPWGTAHALICATDKIDAPFCVINADDFYGQEAFAKMAAYLSKEGSKNGAIAPYKLSQTLSPLGTVARGLCKIQDGYLTAVKELTSIHRNQQGVIVNKDETGKIQCLSENDLASMNFWGFPHFILPHFKSYFENFLKIQGMEPKSECYLPLAVDYFIQAGIIKIRALDVDSVWFGVTYKEDRNEVLKKITELTQKGVYPAHLWQTTC
ncbi:MAG: hypothetical protein LBC53_07810 [Spirochaetaceae bacterium]|jgi:hypothetical protein|nr:hypothetical protein [Spirochaetaceae bacterium]